MKKEIVAIILLFVVASIVFASGLKSEANVSAAWDNSTAEFDVEINDISVPVNEVRLYVSELDGVECNEVDGWFLITLQDYPDVNLGTTDVCWYLTKNPIDDYETFSYTADTPEELSPFNIRIELKEAGKSSGEIVSYIETYEWGVE